MEFENQNKSDVKFLGFGKLSDTLDAEVQIILDENQSFTGILAEIKTVEQVDKKTDNVKMQYKYFFNEYETGTRVMTWGKAALDRQMVTNDDPNFIPVEVGDLVKITFKGMYKTEGGGKGYDLQVGVIRHKNFKKEGVTVK